MYCVARTVAFTARPLRRCHREKKLDHTTPQLHSFSCEHSTPFYNSVALIHYPRLFDLEVPTNALWLLPPTSSNHISPTPPLVQSSLSSKRSIHDRSSAWLAISLNSSEAPFRPYTLDHVDTRFPPDFTHLDLLAGPPRHRLSDLTPVTAERPILQAFVRRSSHAHARRM